jgi:ATP-dependent 26S proteasome regulatory subunit
MIAGAAKEIDVLIRARYPLLYVISWEEHRVLSALAELALRQDKRLFVWTQTMGLQPGTATIPPDSPDEDTIDPAAVLEVIRTSHDPTVYVLKDFHPFLSPNYASSSAIVRKLRDLTGALHTSFKTVVLLSPVLRLPEELEKDVTVVDWPLPSAKELDGLLNTVTRSVQNEPGINVDLHPAEREAVLKAALGMTITEAANVFAKCLVEKKGFDVDLIVAEKEQVIRKSGVLEYYHWSEGMQDVGGLDLLKEWLRQRSTAFTDKAREFGLPAPKGLLLLGVQGCGKSLMAKAVAFEWKLPLLRLDMGRIFAGLVGASEENVRKAIKVAEAVAPCVLWIDEIEKGVSGTRGSSELDSGVTSRVFGTLITWLQEKTAPVFVVATANDVSQLPPELLRKGRFDEIFFVDLPSAPERKDIMAIHLRRRGRNPDDFDLDTLAAKAEGFSGAEIEEAVISAMYGAFHEGRDLRSEDISEAVGQTVPLVVTMEEDIESLRGWARLRARPASAAIEPEA